MLLVIAAIAFISTRSLFNNSHGRNDVNLLFLSLQMLLGAKQTELFSKRGWTRLKILWLFNEMAVFRLFSLSSAPWWNSNVECRYLFYNSLNKRTQSSLCLFIQFSLRSIISNFSLLSPLSSFSFRHPSPPSQSTFHHNKAQWLRTNNWESFLTRVLIRWIHKKMNG